MGECAGSTASCNNSAEKGVVIPVIQMKSSKFTVVNTIIILIAIVITDILNLIEA